MRRAKSFPEFIQSFAVLYLIVWSIAPPLGIDLIYRFIALGLAAVWAVWAFMRKIQLDRIHVYALLFIFAVVIITYFRFNNFSSIIKQIHWYILFVEFIMFAFYYKKDCWDELEWVLPVVLLILILFNFKTAKVLIEDPNIARRIVRMDEEVLQWMRQGIGGYALVYSQVLMFPAGLLWTMKAYKKDTLRLVIGIVWLVSYALLIANASYSIALFSTFASMFVLFFYKGKRVSGVIIITMVLFIGVMAAIMYSVPLQNWLLQTFDGTAVAKKVSDLINPEDTGGEDSIQVRVEQYTHSLQAILQYPLIGSLWRPSKAGTHSHILDNFAMYGWWGGLLNIKMLFTAPRSYKEKYGENSHIIHVANAEFVVMIFISLLDTLSFEMMCPFFLLVPLLFEDIKKWTVKDNEGPLVSKSHSRSGG